MFTPLLDGIIKSARIMGSDLRDQSTGISSSMEEFKSKLSPGDIFLFKPSDRASKAQAGDVNPGRGFVDGTGIYAKIKRMFNRGSDWGHAGIYAGDDKVLHVYPKMHLGDKGYDPEDSSVRVHSLRTMAQKHKRDILAVRPDLTDEQRAKAVDRAREMIGEKFSKKDLIMTALAPWAAKGDPGNGAGTICSGLVARSYPDIAFRGSNSRRVVRPGDLHLSDKVREVAGLSLDDE